MRLKNLSGRSDQLQGGAGGGAGDGGIPPDAGPPCGALGQPCCATNQCNTGLMCTRCGCLDSWAEWPMPNPTSPNQQSYDTSTAGVVIDNVTGLMWQKNVDASSYTVDGACAYCAGLTLAGHGDWRVPTQIELVSIVDFSRASPAIDTGAFGTGAPTDNFWSATPWNADLTYAWMIYFDLGWGDFRYMTNTNRVRCVR